MELQMDLCAEKDNRVLRHWIYAQGEEVSSACLDLIPETLKERQ
jgi:hypothetical protein